MKKYFQRTLFCFFLSFCLVFNAFGNSIDSLRQIAFKSDPPDPFILTKIAREYISISLDSTEYYAQWAYDISKKKKNRHAMGYALWHLGNVRYYSDKTDSALVLYNQALKIMKDEDDEEGISKVYNTIGMVYDIRGDYETAFDYYFKSLEIAEETKSKVDIAAALNNIGIAYYYQGEYKEAIEYLHRSMKIEESSGNISGMLYSLNNIGSIYQDMGEHVEATKCYQEVLYKCNRINDIPGVANACINLGNVHNVKKDYIKAINFFNKALKHYTQLGDKHSIALVYINMGESYKGMGNYDIALQNLTLAYDIESKLGDNFSISKLLKNIGDVYAGKKEYAKAIIYYNESNMLAMRIGYRNQLTENFQALSRLYNDMELYKEALHYLNLYTEVRDSIINAESQKEVAKIRTIYETEKKQRRIEALETENQLKELKIDRARYFALSLVLLVLLLVGTGFLFIRQKQLKARQSNMELEQKLFRLQMNPHFIFNSVSAIQSFIMKNEPLEASSYLSNFARLMRLSLQNSREELISLEIEMETLRYYLDLQKLRMADRMSYTLWVDETLDTREVGIPPMLAQPFIENSIEHGLLKKEGKGNVNVKFFPGNDTLKVEIIDDGVGRDHNNNDKHKEHLSLTTNITLKRLNLLGKKYKCRSSLNYTDLNDENGNSIGTKVDIVIPLILLT